MCCSEAEDKGGEVTVEVLKKHLMERENIPDEEIAIATGKQRGLDGINLFDPAYKINYIITIEALKEGWDCSFAYVFCSVKRVQSDTAVEQLLGRVLRMPYARQRQQEVLNRAYAHLVSPEFAQAAERLKDRLVQMGFDRLEAAIGVQPGTMEPFWHDETDHPITPPQPAAMPFVLTVDTAPDLEALPDEVRERVEVQPLATGFRVTVRGEIIDAIEDALLDAVPKKRQGSHDAHSPASSPATGADRAGGARRTVFAPAAPGRLGAGRIRVAGKGKFHHTGRMEFGDRTGQTGIRSPGGSACIHRGYGCRRGAGGVPQRRHAPT